MMNLPDVNKFVTTLIIMVVLTRQHGVKCSALSGSFSTLSHTGHISSNSFWSKGNVRSQIECAYICLNDRGISPKCAAFNFRRAEMLCDLYAQDTTQRHPERNELYMFVVPASFHYSTYMGQRYAYHTSTFKTNIHVARAHCYSIGAYLAQLDSAEEYDAVFHGTGGRLLREYHYIGHTDEEEEGTWVNDLDGSPMAYSLRWRNGDPDNENMGRTPANCASVVVFGSSWKIHEKACTVKSYHFLCEKDV